MVQSCPLYGHKYYFILWSLTERSLGFYNKDNLLLPQVIVDREGSAALACSLRSKSKLAAGLLKELLDPVSKKLA